MDEEAIGISLCLEKHPVLRESRAFQTEYYRLLEEVMGADASPLLLALLQAYRQALCPEYDRVIDTGTRRPSRFSKLYRFRHVLLCDCVYLNTCCPPEDAKPMPDALADVFPDGMSSLQTLCNILRTDRRSGRYPKTQYHRQCIRKNRLYLQKPIKRILVTANMSAGKTTVINAMAGKRLAQMGNEACTAKVRHVYHKPYEDGCTAILRNNLVLRAEEEGLWEEEDGAPDCLGAYFRILAHSGKRFCIVDSPGVNSFQNPLHRELSLRTVEERAYDRIIYVINVGLIGTYDEAGYLQVILRNAADKGILFVVNKLDTFHLPEDSVEKTLQGLYRYLTDAGFREPVLCPVSAYAGLLAKRALYSDPLNEDEMDELNLFFRKFRREEFDLSAHYPPAMRYKGAVSRQKESIFFQNCRQLLIRCGQYSLEKTILAKL